MSKILSVITLIGVVFSSFLFIDNRYALSTNLAQLEQRVKLNELRDLERKAMEDEFFYKEQSRKYPADKQVKDKLGDAEEQVESIRKRIGELENEI